MIRESRKELGNDLAEVSMGRRGAKKEREGGGEVDLVDLSDIFHLREREGSER